MKVLIATGGSGGHIFPALQTAGKLKGRGHMVTLIGALAAAQEKIAAQGHAVVLLNVSGWNMRSPKDILQFFWRMITSFFYCLYKVSSSGPQMVVGFGGYSSFPVVVAAWILGIPCVIHEQNVVPGKANRRLGVLAKRICISFKNSRSYWPPAKTVLTGCPCHNQISTLTRGAILNKYQLSSNRTTIFVLGGSQGSRFVNEAFFEAIALLPESLKIQVVHATGKADVDVYRKRYAGRNIPYYVADFISPIEEVYSITDLAVARAGASTVSELATFAVPAVFIPYPHAEAHQTANARVLADAGVARILEQKDLSPQKLAEAIKEQLSLGLGKDTVSARIKDLVTVNAAENVAKVCEEYACT